MAGIYVKDAKVPETCDACLSGFVKTIGCTKRMYFNDRDKARHPECPISYVEDHGDLIDRDAFVKQDLVYCAPELINDGQYILLKLEKANVVLGKD